MLTFEKIKEYFECGYWTKEMVNKAAEKGVISTGQAEEIIATEFRCPD